MIIIRINATNFKLQIDLKMILNLNKKKAASTIIETAIFSL